MPTTPVPPGGAPIVPIVPPTPETKISDFDSCKTIDEMIEVAKNLPDTPGIVGNGLNTGNPKDKKMLLDSLEKLKARLDNPSETLENLAAELLNVPKTIETTGMTKDEYENAKPEPNRIPCKKGSLVYKLQRLVLIKTGEEFETTGGGTSDEWEKAFKGYQSDYKHTFDAQLVGFEKAGDSKDKALEAVLTNIEAELAKVEHELEHGSLEGTPEHNESKAKKRALVVTKKMYERKLNKLRGLPDTDDGAETGADKDGVAVGDNEFTNAIMNQALTAEERAKLVAEKKAEDDKKKGIGKKDAEPKPKVPEDIRVAISAINIEELQREAAADTAYRLSQEAKDEDQKKGFILKTLSKLVNNYWGEQKLFNKQKEIEAKIRETGNLNYGLKERTEDESKQEISAVVSRFASEYSDQLINTEKGETREVLTDPALQLSIKRFIKEYAEHAKAGKGGENAEGMAAKREALIAEIGRAAIKHNGGTAASNEELRKYGNNLMEATMKVANMLKAGKEVDFNRLQVDIVVGKAMSALNTTAKFSRVQEWAETLSRKTGIDGTKAAAIAQAAQTTVSLIDLFGKSKLANVFTFGATGVVSGLFAANKEGRMVKKEREAILRETSMGQVTSPDAKRRQEIVKHNYNEEMISAPMLRNAIAESLYEFDGKNELVDKELTKEDFEHVINLIAKAEARINLGNKKGVDLFIHGPQKNQSMANLLLEIAKAKDKLSNEENLKHGDAKGEIKKRAHAIAYGEEGGVMSLDKYIIQKDQNFNSMKNGKMFRKGVSTAIIGSIVGGAVGGVVQEVGATHLFDRSDHIQGALERLWHGKGDTNSTIFNTAFNSAHEKIFGTPDVSSFDDKFHLHPAGPAEEATGINGSCGNVKMPGGYFLGNGADKLPDGSIAKVGTLYHPSGKAMVEGVEFDSNGNVTEQSEKLLGARGVTFSETPIGTTASVEHTNVTAQSFVDNPDHPGTRIHHGPTGWYDNDTLAPKFDHNEQKGDILTGPNGEPMISLKRMITRSWHGKDEMIPMQGAKGWHNVALISPTELTQGKPLVISFDADGTAIVPKEFQQFFPKDASGHYDFSGRYLEYAAMSDTANPDGSYNIKVFATAEGPGTNSLSDEVGVATIGGVVTEFHMPADTIVPPVASGLNTPWPGLIYPQGRAKIEQGKMSAQMAGPAYGKREKSRENDAEKKKSLDTLTFENGVIVIPKIKESKDGKEDKGWTKSKNDIIKGIMKGLAEHEAKGTRPENAVVMLCPEDEADSKKVQELIKELRTDLFKDRGLEFVFVRTEERGLKRDEILFAPHGTLTNLGDIDTTTLFGISKSERQSERTKYIVEQELNRRLPKSIMVPGEKPGDERVEMKLDAISKEKLAEYLKMGGAVFSDTELTAMRREDQRRKKGGTISTPEDEPEEPENMGTDVENKEVVGSDEYFQVLLLGKKFEDFDDVFKAKYEQQVKKYTEGLKRGYNEKVAADTKMNIVKVATRKELNKSFKAVGLQIRPGGEFVSNQWIYWDLGKQSYFSQNKAESDDKKYNLDDPFDLSNNTEAIKSIVNRRIGTEVISTLLLEEHLNKGKGREKVLKDLKLDAVTDKDLIAKIDDLYKRTDPNIFVQDIHGYEYGEIGALLRKKAESKASPAKLTPYLEGLQKGGKDFSFERASDKDIEEIIRMGLADKKLTSIPDGGAKINTKIFVLGKKDKTAVKGTVKVAANIDKISVVLSDKAKTTKEYTYKENEFFAAQQVNKYVESLGMKIEVRKAPTIETFDKLTDAEIEAAVTKMETTGTANPLDDNNIKKDLIVFSGKDRKIAKVLNIKTKGGEKSFTLEFAGGATISHKAADCALYDPKTIKEYIRLNP